MPTDKSIVQMSIPELKKKYNMQAQKGKLINEGGKYYAVVDSEKIEIDPSYVISNAPLRSIIGYPIVIGRGPGFLLIIYDGGIKKVLIMCYKPQVELVQKISDEVRKTVLNSCVNAGIITPPMAANINNFMTTNAIRG